MLKHVSRVASQIAVFAVFFVAWELIVDLMHVRPVILPSPSEVFVSIWTHRAYLMMHTWPTFLAVGGGFLFAAIAGVLIAIGIAYSKWVSEVTYPFLVAAQVLPKIALAPLFLIWFGFGLTPKIVIAALIAFFPIVINTARGLQSVDVELMQYMKSLGASWHEVFFKISLPWALPYMFASFKIASDSGCRWRGGRRIRRLGPGAWVRNQLREHISRHRAYVRGNLRAQRPRRAVLFSRRARRDGASVVASRNRGYARNCVANFIGHAEN